MVVGTRDARNRDRGDVVSRISRTSAAADARRFPAWRRSAVRRMNVSDEGRTPERFQGPYHLGQRVQVDRPAAAARPRLPAGRRSARAPRRSSFSATASGRTATAAIHRSSAGTIKVNEHVVDGHRRDAGRLQVPEQRRSAGCRSRTCRASPSRSATARNIERVRPAGRPVSRVRRRSRR